MVRVPLMESSSQISKKDCSPVRLQEYLDGELSRVYEIEIEHHLASCSACLYELNLQKTVLGVLDHRIEPALPKDFAEVVAAKAESQVTGLRRKRERIYALAVATFLVMTVLMLLAFDLSRPMASIGALVGKLAAFFVLIGNIILNLVIGIYVIAKVVAQQADREMAILVFAVTIAISVIAFWVVRSGKISELKEIKR